MFNCQVPIVDGYIKLYPYKITIFLVKSSMHRGSIRFCLLVKSPNFCSGYISVFAACIPA
jgi:hypothetical protein